MLKRPPFAVVLVLAIVASASTWFYMNRILVAQQVADATARHRPRGNLSDLYPRWLGARELLLHHRNPYSSDVTQQIQQGYYGRAIDPSNPDDPRDQQAFAYPVYVVFLLAPTVELPFATVQASFRWILFALVVADVFLWFYILCRPADLRFKILFVILLLGWTPVVQGLKLQQLTLLVMALISGSAACVAAGWLGVGGILLALSTIKPQLAAPVVVWLLMWAASDWRKRYKFLIGFGIMIALLLAGAEVELPGWFGMFLKAISEYRTYTRGEALLNVLFGQFIGSSLQIIAIALSAVCLWQARRSLAKSDAFGRCFALALGLTLVLLPMSALYNQLLLAPGILALVQTESAEDPIDRPGGLARIAAGLLLVWPWIATIGLALAYVWITPEIRSHVVQLPFYSSIVMPVLVFGVLLLDLWSSRDARNHAASLPDAARPE